MKNKAKYNITKSSYENFFPYNFKAVAHFLLYITERAAVNNNNNNKWPQHTTRTQFGGNIIKCYSCWISA